MPMKDSLGHKPLVTVITVVRNGARHLEQAILSVLGQSYDHIEYIIIDGGSVDGTLDIIRSYEDRLAYWVSERDSGIYDAMNKGIQASSGELINLLNADDYLEPASVETIVGRYIRFGRPAVYFGLAYAVDDAFAVKAEMFPTMRFWVGMTINHQAMFVHKAVYEQVGLYNSAYSLAGDFDFLVRCMQAKVPFLSIDRCLVNFRNSGTSVTESKRYRREAGIVSRSHFPFFSLKRADFLFFNYFWLPFKRGCRALLYKTFGVRGSRRMIRLLKKLLLGQKETTIYFKKRGTNDRKT